MITVITDRRLHCYSVSKDDLVWFVTLSRSGAVVPNGGPPGDVVPDDIPQAVAEFNLAQAAAEGEVRH